MRLNRGLTVWCRVLM